VDNIAKADATQYEATTTSFKALHCAIGACFAFILATPFFSIHLELVLQYIA
jgi:hypothetical protein